MRGIVIFLLVLLALFAQNPVRFVDVAQQAGLKAVIYCGGEHSKNYIIETLGPASLSSISITTVISISSS